MRHPIPFPGERQVWCRWYSRCLDLAARESWETFSCEGCERRHVVDQSDPYPLFCIHALVWAVCFPKAWRRTSRFSETGGSSHKTGITPR